MEEPNVRIRPFDRLAVQLEDQAQHSVSSGVLRSKIQLHVPEACHIQLFMHRNVFISVGLRSRIQIDRLDPDPGGQK